MPTTLQHLGRVSTILLRTAAALALTLLVISTAAQLGQAQTFTLLYTFPGAESGANPGAGLTRDVNGNLYGTTENGGGYNHGMAFKLSTTGVESWLHQFKGAPSDGAQVVASLVPDTKGNLYGTSAWGGGGACFQPEVGCGTVFELSLLAGRWTETVLYSFTGVADGDDPQAGLIQDAAGNFYGTTRLGGTTNTCKMGFGCGTVFELTLSAGHWTKTVLYSFTNQTGDGVEPQAGLIRDNSGNLYGTTELGGANYDGTVFELTPSGGRWTETVLYHFGGADGKFPMAGVVRDTAGNLYGTTTNGGNPICNCGVVFQLDTTGKQTVLHTFSGGADGAYPGALVIGSHGYLYGTTTNGGDLTCNCGTIFKVNSAGTEAVLYSFAGGTDGAMPNSGLIRDVAGNLYGTTFSGGADNRGTIFMIAR
jgi:uncharacterized repeat protein (TIGR03803 family)